MAPDNVEGCAPWIQNFLYLFSWGLITVAAGPLRTSMWALVKILSFWVEVVGIVAVGQVLEGWHGNGLVLKAVGWGQRSCSDSEGLGFSCLSGSCGAFHGHVVSFHAHMVGSSAVPCYRMISVWVGCSGCLEGGRQYCSWVGAAGFRQRGLDVFRAGVIDNNG